MSFETVDLYSSSLTIEETADSPEREESRTPRATRRFRVFGTDNAADAYSAMMSYLETNFYSSYLDGIGTFDIPLASVRQEKVEHTYVYNFECNFEFPSDDTSSSINDTSYSYPDVEDSDYQFSVSGGTSHISHSLSTLYAVAASGYNVRNFGGGIGVNEEGTFDGVDIVTPRVAFSITVSRAKSYLTSAMRLAYANAVGCINDATFDSYAAGEVLFKGFSARPTWFSYNDSSGNTYKDWYWRISYSFEASPTVTMTLNNTTITKRGFDYLWRLTEKYENTSTGQLDSVVRQINVEQVYPEYDFSAFGLTFPE